MLRESQWYRRCGLVQVHHESPWSSADVDACIDSMLDRLAEDDREFTVHDCLLQPEGVHIAVTCADRDLGSE